MKFIKQTTFGKDGNCLMACIASILDLKIEDIPNPKHDGWINELNEWLINKTGYYIQTIGFNEDSYFSESFISSVKIGVGKSSSGLRHAVLVKGNEIIHDPLGYKALDINNIVEYDLIIKY